LVLTALSIQPSALKEKLRGVYKEDLPEFSFHEFIEIDFSTPNTKMPWDRNISKNEKARVLA
jgi:hypothetical protein